MDETLTKLGPDPFGEVDSLVIPDTHLVLVLVWSLEEPHRVGEVLLPPEGANQGAFSFGRNSGAPGQAGSEGHFQLFRSRPGGLEPQGPAKASRVSRLQLKFTLKDASPASVENIGRCPLLLNGKEVSRASLFPGDVLELKSQLLFYCEERPKDLSPHSPGHAYGAFPYAMPDPFGLVGESPVVWALRRRIAFLARADSHLLVQGPSGSGKELVVQAIHQLSVRGNRALISRNAATMPLSLVDVELFGNAPGFPNPGMAERPGLIGAAHRSTLLLDELGELPTELQTHLLRVLDSGEYQRLGDAKTRHSNLRLIGITNRNDTGLKHDLQARLKLNLQVPSLEERRGDIPLLARHLVKRISKTIPEIAETFFSGGHSKGEPRFSPALITRLLRLPYPLNIRQLESRLYEAVEGSKGPYISVVPGMEKTSTSRKNLAKAAKGDEPDIKDIRRALLKHKTGRDASKELGISYRKLIYILEKQGLSIRSLQHGGEK